jgi:hypothetical protein
VARTSRSEDLVYLGFTFWTTVGLCLDGWAHRHQPELESFLTPWHAVFYSGFGLAAAWLAGMTMRRRSASATLLGAVPDGYRPAAVGLVVFAAGGVSDGIWHTVFGVETSLDALLSPTHLVLLVGLLLGSTAPLRAAWRDPDSRRRSSFGALLAPVLSLTASVTIVAFFFLYANGFNNWAMTRRFTPGGDGEALAALGVLSTLVSTVILLAATMILVRRWHPPLGALTLLFGFCGSFLAGLDAFQFWWQVFAPLAGGVAADLLLAGRSGDRIGPVSRVRMAGIVVPLVMWSISTAVTQLAWGIRWPPELWLGAIAMAVLAGWAVTLVSHPPDQPAAASELAAP